MELQGLGTSPLVGVRVEPRTKLHAARSQALFRRGLCQVAGVASETPLPLV